MSIDFHGCFSLSMWGELIWAGLPGLFLPCCEALDYADNYTATRVRLPPVHTPTSCGWGKFPHRLEEPAHYQPSIAWEPKRPSLQPYHCHLLVIFYPSPHSLGSAVIIHKMIAKKGSILRVIAVWAVLSCEASAYCVCCLCKGCFLWWNGALCQPRLFIYFIFFLSVIATAVHFQIAEKVIRRGWIRSEDERTDNTACQQQSAWCNAASLNNTMPRWYTSWEIITFCSSKHVEN